MSAQKDYYEVLGVERGSDEAAIKKAYKRLAMKHHPDRHKGDKAAEEKFKEIQEAYSVLSDANKRKMYDQFGHAGVDGAAGGGAGGFGGFGGFGGGAEGVDLGGVFGDIFGDIFGGGGGGASAQPGANLRYNLALTLEDAVKGKTVEITVPTLVACDVCHGSGAKPGTKPVTCSDCQGTGQLHMQQGFFTVQQTCPTCRGKGTLIKEHCTACRGHGRRQDNKKLSVKIPAGVDTGDRIRLAGEGEAGEAGAPPGDLYVQVEVREHALFKRHESNLHCEVPIDLVTAALGGEVEVPTLEGRVKLKIAAGTQSGKLLRMRGKGVKPVRGGAIGDLLCHIIVEVPVNLSGEQQGLLKKFAESLQQDKASHSPQTISWLDKVKSFFESK